MLLMEKNRTIKMLLCVPDRKYKKQKLGNKSKRQNVQNWAVIHLVRQTRKRYKSYKPNN